MTNGTCVFSGTRVTLFREKPKYTYAMLNLYNLFQLMKNAMRQQLGERWGAARIFVESESLKYIEHLSEVSCWCERGDISPQKGFALMNAHQRNLVVTLVILLEISDEAAEVMVCQAVDAIRQSVNSSHDAELL